MFNSKLDIVKENISELENKRLPGMHKDESRWKMKKRGQEI